MHSVAPGDVAQMRKHAYHQVRTGQLPYDCFSKQAYHPYQAMLPKTVNRHLDN